MVEIIIQNKNEIKQLCVQHHVESLYVFGSVVSNRFTDKSDIDFLVEFKSIEPKEYFNNYMGFKESLVELLKRPIDLVEVQTLKNPFLARSIHSTKKLVYERRNSKMAV